MSAYVTKRINQLLFSEARDFNLKVISELEREVSCLVENT